MMHTDFKLTVAATRDALTLDEFKEYQRVYNDSDGERMMEEIRNARHFVETHSGLILSESTYQIAQPCFSGTRGEISIPISPIREVVSLSYYDSSGSLVVMPDADYRLHSHATIHTITPAMNKTWPICEPNRPDGVILEVIAGCVADGDTNSAELMMDKFNIGKRAIAMLASHLFENGLVAPIQLHATPMAFQALMNTIKLEPF